MAQVMRLTSFTAAFVKAFMEIMDDSTYKYSFGVEQQSL